jgi:gliding motility-associated-like protein
MRLFSKELIFLGKFISNNSMGCSKRSFFLALSCYLFFLPVSPVTLSGQISSAGYASVEKSGYTAGEPAVNDNIYIFCNENGNLTASLTGSSGDLDFEWSLYNSSLPGFNIPFSTSTGRNSLITNLESGGYQVRIRDGNGIDTFFRAWVYVNRPRLNAAVTRHDCEVLDLAGSVTTESFHYFNPGNNDGYSLTAGFDFTWSAHPHIPISPRLDPRIWNPPPVVTEYTLTAEHLLCQASFTIREEPLTTRAEFVIDPVEGEAPLEAVFNAVKSENAGEYHWYFDYIPGGINVRSDDTSPDPVHIYNKPGEYRVTLRTVAGLCKDEFTFPEHVRVYPSELEVPNVFSPNGDGYNDSFMVRAVSLREFRALVFNRDGRKIFEWSDPSVGWDGKIGGSNLASPGVYFYVITGTGWDDRKYEFTGPLYLYRGK